MNATQALQTREAAAATAWVVYQRNVVGLSVMAICALAASDSIRLDDGAYAYHGGLGRPLARSTVYLYLAEAREQFKEDYLRRPVLDHIMEEDDRLEHLAAMHMADARAADVGTDKRAKSLDSYLRTLESRRKLLGIDRPQQVEVTHTDGGHDDPATVKLKLAMEKAAARTEAMKAEVQAEDE